jgi:hypothetical protein
VDTLVRRPNARFLQVMPDAAHVYLIADGQILRIARTPGAESETFWQEGGRAAWAMAETESHVYWSVDVPSVNSDCGEAQVLRRAKAGGAVATLARTPGYCAGQLVRVGDHLYTAVWVGPPQAAPTKILRIRL